MIVADPAWAHTEIDHTTPSDGASVEAGIQTLEVFFTDQILNLADSSEMVILDSNGVAVPSTCIQVEDQKISANVLIKDAGHFDVTWRTVAEDGHPISGKFSFEATGTSDITTFEACADQASSGTVISTPKANVPQKSADETPWWILMSVLVAVAIAVIGFLIARYRRAPQR